MMFKFMAFVIFLTASFATWALPNAEPSYCEPSAFYKREIQSPLSPNENKDLPRLHAFHVGSVTLAGLAVGDSKTPITKKLALTMSDLNVEDNKFCTWYFAKGNKSALASFISRPLPDPFSIKVETSAKIFMDAIQSSFFNNEGMNFIDCAKDHHYIAMGCTEQRHRGPTVFGMLLAFSGCTPEHSATIVNTIWGLNTLKPEVRFTAIKAAYNYGSVHSEKRNELAELFTRE